MRWLFLVLGVAIMVEAALLVQSSGNRFGWVFVVFGLPYVLAAVLWRRS